MNDVNRFLKFADNPWGADPALVNAVVFEDSHFHRGLDAVLPSPKTPPDFEVDELRVAFVQAIAENSEICRIFESPPYKSQWAALSGFARFLLCGDVKNLQCVIDAVNSLHPSTANTDFSPPADSGSIINKFVEKKDNLRHDVFKGKSWTPGQFLVYDLLDARFIARSVEFERTPILVVVGGEGIVFWLTVERRPGGDGLVMPDWWSLGMIELGGDGAGNFRTVVESAILAAKPKPGYRITWRLSPFGGNGLKVEKVEDASAQAAAACCVLALNDRAAPEGDAILDEKVAISACLLNHSGDAKDIRLGPVESTSFESKLKAAGEAKLLGFLHSLGQTNNGKPLPEVYSNPKNLKGQEVVLSGVHLLGVENLDDAYDSLKISSKAVAEYKKELHAAWKEKWNPKPTPGEFRKAAT